MKRLLAAGLINVLLAGQVLAGALAYITNQGSHDVSVVDVDTARVSPRCRPASRRPACA
jgi:hypothetical protein